MTRHSQLLGEMASFAVRCRPSSLKLLYTVKEPLGSNITASTASRYLHSGPVNMRQTDPLGAATRGPPAMKATP